MVCSLRLIAPLALCLALSAPPGLAVADDSARYAGVEVGAKGVKGVVIEVTREASGNPVKVLLSKSANPTVGLLKDGEFRPRAIEEAADEIANFVKLFSEAHQVPIDHIRAVASSALEKVKNRNRLAAAVKEKTGLDLPFLTPEREVGLTIDGLAIQQERGRVTAIDIGSGNTKGGYYAGPERLETFSIGYGTVSFTSAIKQQLAGRTFPEAAELLRESLVAPALKSQLDARPGLRSQPDLYLTGGIVWAMASLVRPSEVDEPLVKLGGSDLAAFRKLLAANPSRFPTVETASIDDPARRARSEKEVAQVRDVFTPENLVAGAELIRATLEALGTDDRSIVFARNGMVAWVLAYVTPDDLKRSLGSVQFVPTSAPAAPQPPAPAAPPVAGAAAVGHDAEARPSVVPGSERVPAAPTKPGLPPVPGKSLPATDGGPGPLARAES